MMASFVAPLTAAGAALAAAIAFAPLAAAGNDAECNSSNLASLCQRSGHSAIVATPGSTNGPAGYPFGAGSVQSIWALD